MIAVTTGSAIEGYRISQYKRTAQGATFDELLRHATTLGANAVLNACYDDALDIETLYHAPLSWSIRSMSSYTLEDRSLTGWIPETACSKVAPRLKQSVSGPGEALSVRCSGAVNPAV